MHNLNIKIISAISFAFLSLFLSYQSSAGSHGKDKSNYLKPTVQLGPRPFFLVDDMDKSRLKKQLQYCASSKKRYRSTDFSIGHRGAAMQFPEHTQESYIAAAKTGAGIIECDVTFTKDRALVCRHSQCDLHTTTNILATPLAERCSEGFSPAVLDPVSGEILQPASAMCCTSDITLAEFKQLEGKMDGANASATTVADYLKGTADWRTDLYAAKGTLVTHAESIELIRSLGAKFTPELKSPSVEMPFEGEYSQEDYAQQMIQEYRDAGIPARQVWPQSFNLEDVLYWIEQEPRFGRQAVYLDGRYSDPSFDHTDPSTYSPSMESLVEQNVNIIAPPMWMLLQSKNGKIKPSVYAKNAKKAGLNIITWTLERSAPLANDGAWYHQTTDDIVDNDGDKLVSLDVLAQDVGVIGVFTDWPSTVTFYANCMGL